MFQAFRMQKMHWNKPLFFRLGLKKFSQEVGNHGKEFYYTVHLEQVRPFWQKLAQLKLMVPFSQFLLLISWASMWERVKNWSRLCLTVHEKKSHQLFLLIKSIPWLEIDPMVRTKLPEELKHSFWCRCKVLDTMIQAFWFLEQQIFLGHWIQLFVEGFREEFISHYLSLKLGKLYFIKTWNAQERNERYSQRANWNWFWGIRKIHLTL